MKGIVLTVAGFFVATVSSLGGTVDFGVEADRSFMRDPAGTLRVPVVQQQSVGQWKTDARSELRGSRPILAYTLFRFESKYADVAVQPVLGRINGTQLYLSF